MMLQKFAFALFENTTENSLMFMIYLLNLDSAGNEIYMFKKIILFLLLIMLKNPCFAEQTIFNIPSADITPKGRVCLQQEAQFRTWGDDAFFTGTTYGALGLGNNTELSLDLFNVNVPLTRNISLGVGFKSSSPIAGLEEKFPEREFKFTVGSNVLIGLEGNGVGNWSYTHLSGRVPKLNTRITAGLSFGTRQAFGETNLSFIGAVEQPITKKMNLIAEWYSGKSHLNGLLIVGGSYALPKETTIHLGYQIPNTPQNGVSGFVVQVSKMF